MPGKVLVYGGKGGLGHVVVETFKKLGYWVLSVDIVEQTSADHNVLVSLEETWTGQESQVTEGVGAALNVSEGETLHSSRPSYFVLSRGTSLRPSSTWPGAGRGARPVTRTGSRTLTSCGNNQSGAQPSALAWQLNTSRQEVSWSCREPSPAPEELLA